MHLEKVDSSPVWLCPGQMLIGQEAILPGCDWRPALRDSSSIGSYWPGLGSLTDPAPVCLPPKDLGMASVVKKQISRATTSGALWILALKDGASSLLGLCVKHTVQVFSTGTPSGVV